MERMAGLPVRETAAGKDSHVVRHAYYTHAELGMSLAGLNAEQKNGSDRQERSLPYLAAMYSFALDEEVRADLYRGLRDVVARMARAEKWPVRVAGLNGEPHHYQDELADLVLDSDWYKPLFVKSYTDHRVCLEAVYLDVTEEVWRAKLMGPYLRVLSRYERWLAIARSFIDRKLHEHLHRDDALAA